MTRQQKSSFARITKAEAGSGDGVIKFTISTSAIDRHGEILDVASLTTDRFMENPVVLFAHEYGSLPVGKIVSMMKTGPGNGELIGECQLAIDEYPFAETLYKLWVGGYINAVSIGFIVHDIEIKMEEGEEEVWVYKNAEMIEVSLAPIPANPEALRRAVSKGVIEKSDAETLKKVVKVMRKHGDAGIAKLTDTSDDEDQPIEDAPAEDTQVDSDDAEQKTKKSKTKPSASAKEEPVTTGDLSTLEGKVEALTKLSSRLSKDVLALRETEKSGAPGDPAARRSKRIRLVTVRRTAKLAQPVLEGVLRETKARSRKAAHGHKAKRRIKLVTKKG